MTSLQASEMGGSNTALLAVFAGIFVATYFAVNKWGQGKRGRLPPSLPTVPIIGSMPFLPGLEHLPRFFTQTSEKLGAVFAFQLGSEYAIVLNSREAIDEALLKHAVPFAGRTVGYITKHLYNLKHQGIIQKQYGPELRKNQQNTLSVLREFGFGKDLMEERILIEAEELVSLLSARKGRPVNPTHMLSMCSLNVVNSVIFGERLSQTNARLSELADNIFEAVRSRIHDVNVFPLLRFTPGFSSIKSQTLRTLGNVHEYIEENVDKSLASDEPSFVKTYVEKLGNAFDRSELVYILKDLLLAGSETTATSLQWAFVLLANDQKIQKRLRDDIDAVLPNGKAPTMSDLPKLPYVEAAILELSRCKTVVPLALPHMTLEDSEVQGYFVPKGTKVIPNLYSVHMDPKEWPEPEVYRPERFLDQAGNVVRKNRVIPFSVGKRSCLGEFLARQELFLLFTTLVQKFDILPPEGSDRIECTQHLKITMGPSPFQVRLVPR